MAYPALQINNGETVVYTPAPDNVSGTPITFTAPFAEREGQPAERSNNQMKVPRQATLEAPVSVVVDGSPQTMTYGPFDTFLILGTLWKFDRFGPRDAAQVTIHLKATGSDVHLGRAGRR